MDELKQPAGIADLERLAQVSSSPDPAVVALVRAARRAHRSNQVIGQISEDLFLALAPFKHIEGEKP